MKPSPIQLLMERITGGRYKPNPAKDVFWVIVYLVTCWIGVGLIWLALVLMFSV